MQATISATGGYLDQHCKGKSTGMTGREVSRAIAVANSIDYYNKKTCRFARRRHRHYFDQIASQVKQYNGKVGSHPPKTIRDSLEERSAMVLGFAPQDRSFTPSRLDPQTLRTTRSLYVLVGEEIVRRAGEDDSTPDVAAETPPPNSEHHADELLSSIPDTRSEPSPPQRESRAEGGATR